MVMTQNRGTSEDKLCNLYKAFLRAGSEEPLLADAGELGWPRAGGNGGMYLC